MYKKCNYYRNSFCLVCANFTVIKDRIKIDETIKTAYKYCFKRDLIAHQFSPGIVCMECKNQMIESSTKKSKLIKFKIPAEWSIPDEEHENCFFCKLKANKLSQVKSSVKSSVKSPVKSLAKSLAKSSVKSPVDKSSKCNEQNKRMVKLNDFLKCKKLDKKSNEESTSSKQIINKSLDTKPIVNFVNLNDKINYDLSTIGDIEMDDENNSKFSNLKTDKRNTRSNKLNDDKLNDNKLNDDKSDDNQSNNDKSNDNQSNDDKLNNDKLIDSDQIDGPIIYNQRTLDEFAIYLKETSSFDDFTKNRVYYCSNVPIPDKRLKLNITRIDLERTVKELNLTINLN